VNWRAMLRHGFRSPSPNSGWESVGELRRTGVRGFRKARRRVPLQWMCFLGSLGQTCLVHAQTPDVLVHLDVRLSYQAYQDGGTAVRWYDTLGRRSTVGLSLSLEPGLKFVATQRLQRIPGDGDPDQIDEYYLEDPGSWRVGKQELPFGPKFLNRETAIAARTDTDFFYGRLPISVAACDAGPERQQGVVARIGGRLGVSFEVGDHFGISATSLAIFRRPEQSPGIGAGFKRVFGVDYAEKSGPMTTRIEFVAEREGETTQDTNENALAIETTLSPSRHRSVSVGFARAFQQSTDVLWISGSFRIANGLAIEPLVRYKDGQVLDFCLALRVKL